MKRSKLLKACTYWNVVSFGIICDNTYCSKHVHIEISGLWRSSALIRIAQSMYIVTCLVFRVICDNTKVTTDVILDLCQTIQNALDRMEYTLCLFVLPHQGIWHNWSSYITKKTWIVWGQRDRSLMAWWQVAICLTRGYTT